MFSTGNVIRGNTIDGVHSLYYPREEWMYAKYPTPDGRWGDYVKAIHLDDQVGGFLIEGREMLSIFSVSVNFPVKNNQLPRQALDKRKKRSKGSNRERFHHCAGNNFSNYSFGFDINGGGRHTIRGNLFGACPDKQCTTVIAQHAVGGKRPWTKANKVPCEAIRCNTDSFSLEFLG